MGRVDVLGEWRFTTGYSRALCLLNSGTSGTVMLCMGSWDQRDGDVECGELGCGKVMLCVGSWDQRDGDVVCLELGTAGW